MSDKKEPESFREQVAEKGQVIKTLVSIAVFTGYGAGTVKAHAVPVAKAIRTKIVDLMPEGMRFAGYAYKEAVAMGLEEESFRMASRATARAKRHAAAALRASAAGVMA